MDTRTVEIPALQGTMYNGTLAPAWATFTVFKCDVCKRIRQSTDATTTGYGLNEDHTIRTCFDCCGALDLKRLETDERIDLYVVKIKGRYCVTNWTGSMKIFAVETQRGDHNMAGRGARLDVWFNHNGRKWHGVNIGDNDVLRCRKLKAKQR